MKKSMMMLLLVLPILAVMVLACGPKEPAQGEEEPDLLQEKSPDLGEQEPEFLPAYELGDEYRTGPGGYAFNLVPEYTYEEFYGIVKLDAPDADPELGPTIILIGGVNDESRSADEMLDDFISGLGDQGEVSNQREITVGGRQGLMVDVELTIDDVQALGKAAFVEVSPTQMFSMVATAPTADMVDEFPDILEALLASITFFEPEVDEAAIPTPEPVIPTATQVVVAQTEIIRQWASTAKASSQYSDPDWAPEQATGAPDTPDCGDLETAWASLEPDGIDWLEVSYENPVTPTEVNIYESHTPTQVSLVEILDVNGEYHQVYSAVPEMRIDCPYILSIEIEDADYKAAAVKITVDQSVIDLPWDEIDAVELVGYVEIGGDITQKPAEPGGDENPEATDVPAVKPPSVGSVGATGMTPVDATDVSGWKWTSYSTADGLSDDMILSVAVAPDGTAWAGNFNAGVSRIQDGKITNYGVDDGLGYKNGNALAIESDGSVWAGTTVGLGFFDGQSWVNYTKADGLVYETVNALLVAPDGSLWVGTSSGVSHYDGGTWTNYKEEDGLVDNTINDIAVAEDGTVWFATLDGVSSFDGNQWVSYTEADGLAYDITTAIEVDRDGAVWVGTSSKGVSRFDGQEWQTYLESDDYDLAYVKEILTDQDGALWFTTEGEGIYRYDGQEWLHITKNEGLPGNYVDAAALDPDGSLWFGFRREGIAHFGP